MAFFLFLLLIGLAVALAVLAARVSDLTDRIEVLERASVKSDLQPVRRPEPVAPPPHVVVAPPRPAAAPETAVAPVTMPEREPKPQPKPQPQLQPEPEPASSIDWEALLGGNVLNKVGALVLVVGLALFLSYLGAHSTPAMRVIGAAVASFALLAGGVFAQKREDYATFARGLTGAGWAGLYATAYAAWAVDAARVIPNAVVGSALQVAVAAAMITYSLRYRSQAVTGIAFFCAFTALEISPSTHLAVIGAVPLACAVLWLAHRFAWYEMALAGAAATWMLTATRGDSGASLAASMLFLAFLWILFEAFDVLRLQRGVQGWSVDALMPLNGLALTGISWNVWSAREPQTMWRMAVTLAVLFFASAAIRRMVSAAGHWQAPATASALLAAMAIQGRAGVAWVNPMLAVEAEIVYLAGRRLQSRVLCALASAGFAASAFHCFRLAAAPLHVSWTPVAMLQVSMYYANLLLGGSVLFGWSAAVLGSALLMHWAPQGFQGIALLGYSAVLFEIAWPHFRRQAAAVAAAGLVASVLATGQPVWLSAATAFAFFLAGAVRASRLAMSVAASVISAAAALCGMAVMWRAVPDAYVATAWVVLGYALLELGLARFPEQMRWSGLVTELVGLFWLLVTCTPPQTAHWQQFGAVGVVALLTAVRFDLARNAGIAVGAAALATSAWLIVPDRYVALAWLGMAALILEAGLRKRIAVAKWTAVTLSGAAALQSMPVLGAPTLCVVGALFLGGWRLRGDVWVSEALRWTATLLTVLLVRHQLPLFAHPVALAMFGLTLLLTGLPRQAAVAGLFAWTGAVAGTQTWQWTAPVVACFYAAQFLCERDRIRRALSVAATCLLSILVWHQASGQLLTVALGAEGVLLLAAGFPLRERILRLQGLALLLGCIVKLFVWDLRNLETLYRILSFITLGVLLLAVSWFYARFRERLRGLL